jgi:transcriptional regulator with XRE-family HTH domain
VKSPSQVARQRIKELRNRHGWSQQQLADRLAELGSPMDRVAIAKLEGETKPRGLSLDEALLFALALDVAPTNLFLPLDEDEDVQIAPNVTVPMAAARKWVVGARPLDAQDWRLYYSEVPEKDFLAHRALGNMEHREFMDDFQRVQREYRESIQKHQREGETLEETEFRLEQTLEEGDES